MTFITGQTVPTPKATGFFGRIGSTIGKMMVAMIEANPQYRKLQRLQAMTDDELAKIGLTREDIPRHVFAGKLYL